MYCFFFGHDYERFDIRSYVKLLRCHRCGKRWVMSDKHHAFLRYDNNSILKNDLKVVYPELESYDI